MRDSNIVVCDNVGCLGRKTTLKIKRDGSVEVSFTFLDLSCLGLLIGINQPLEVVLLELTNIWMILLLSDLDTLVPSVKFLIHSHRLFDLVVLKKNGFSTVELLVKYCELRLNSEVLETLRCNQLVDLSQIVSLGNVTKGSIASLGNVEVLLLNCQFGKGRPVGLNFWCHI